MRFGYEVFHVDVHALTDFYTRVLGFTPDDPDADGGYATVSRDGLRVGCCRFADARPEQRRPPAGSEVVLHVSDVRAELARVESVGWPLADALQERPWGMTDFRLFDPSGQYIRVTGPGRDAR